MNSSIKEKPLFLQEITINQLKKDHCDELKLNNNAKKIAQFIQQKLLQQTQHKASSNYYYKYVYPSFNKDMILKNQRNFSNALSQTYYRLKDISNLKFDSRNVRFPFEFYTCDEEIHFQLEQYINIYLLNSKELEEIEQEGEVSKNMFIVSDERYLGEIPQLRLNEAKELLQGYMNSQEIEVISLIHKNISHLTPQICKSIRECFNIENDLSWDFETIEKCLYQDIKKDSSKTLEFVRDLPKKIELKNTELKEKIKNIQLELQGDDLIEMLQSNDTLNIQQKLQSTLKEEINTFEKELQEEFKNHGFSKQILFSTKKYPLELDEEIIDSLYKEIEYKEHQTYIDFYFSFSKPTKQELNIAIEYLLCYDLLYSMQQFITTSSIYPKIEEELVLEDALNPKIDGATPITYGLNTSLLKSQPLNSESIAVLTGANSGGKTTLLELIISMHFLALSGLPLNSSKAIIPNVEEIVYLKKFSGTVGSGAFEQTIRELLSIVSTPTSKLLLIDEFEAITEPGAAATILTLFLEEISNHNVYCISVSHLGKEIKEFVESQGIQSIRIDGISAQGLDEKGNLITNHQPVFNSLGESTPELILQRIYNDESFFKNKDNSVKMLLNKIINYNK